MDKEVVVECRNVYLWIPGEVVDDKTYLPGYEGRSPCLRFRMRSRRFERYDFGVTVYDFRNSDPRVWKPLQGSRAFLSVRKGESKEGEFTFIVLNEPSGPAQGIVAKAYCVPDRAVLDELDEVMFSLTFGSRGDEGAELWWFIVGREKREKKRSGVLSSQLLEQEREWVKKISEVLLEKKKRNELDEH